MRTILLPGFTIQRVKKTGLLSILTEPVKTVRQALAGRLFHTKGNLNILSLAGRWPRRALGYRKFSLLI